MLKMVLYAMNKEIWSVGRGLSEVQGSAKRFADPVHWGYPPTNRTALTQTLIRAWALVFGPLDHRLYFSSILGVSPALIAATDPLADPSVHNQSILVTCVAAL